jgi:hypothetical protein
MPPETVRAYASVLVELDLDVCAEACGRLVRSSEFLPSVSAILEETERVETERRIAWVEQRHLADREEYAEEELVGPTPEFLAALGRMKQAVNQRTMEGHHEAA